MTNVLGVPIDDDGGQQVQASHAVVLALGGSIADFALTANAQSVFQGMVSLPLIQTNIGASLHIGIEQPVDNEQRSLNAPNFPQGRKPGRPPLEAETVLALQNLVQAGMTAGQAAKQLGIARSTAYRLIKETAPYNKLFIFIEMFNNDGLSTNLFDKNSILLPHS